MGFILSLPFRLIKFVFVTLSAVLGFVWTFASALLNPANLIIVILLGFGLYYYFTEMQ